MPATELFLYERFRRAVFIAGGFLQQLGLILGFDFQNDLLDVLAVGALGFRLVTVEIPIRRMHRHTQTLHRPFTVFRNTQHERMFPVGEGLAFETNN